MNSNVQSHPGPLGGGRGHSEPLPLGLLANLWECCSLVAEWGWDGENRREKEGSEKGLKV